MPLNLSKAWSEADVADVLGSVNDDRSWRMVIMKTGDVYLVAANGPSPTRDPEIHGVLETWDHGNGYVGENAARDGRWVHEVAETLRQNWPNLKGDKYIDH